MEEILEEFILDPNQLYYTMIEFYLNHRDLLNPDTGLKAKVQIFNEGSSRSAKTWSAIQLIVSFCDNHRYTKKPYIIYIIRETLKSCREIAYEVDFKPCLKVMGVFDQRCATGENQSPRYDLWGNEIRFVGADAKEELGASDILYFNELLDHDNEASFKDMILRCTMLVIGDWNPKYTDHWVFKWENRQNTLFTKTTFRDNKFLPDTVISSILESCPWDLRDYDVENRCWRTLDENKRPPNERNIRLGTANRRRWMVYGEGERCAEEGAVFSNYDWVDDFPETGLDEVVLGDDFGYSADPSALTRIGRRGFDLFIQLLVYHPTQTAAEHYAAIAPWLLEEENRRKREAMGVGYADIQLSCDSSDKNKDGEEFVKQLNMISIHRGVMWTFLKTHKIGITAGIAVINKFRLHFVRYPSNKMEGNPLRLEVEGYTYKYVEGRQTNIPIDKNNHAIDSFRYAIVDNFFWLVAEDTTG